MKIPDAALVLAATEQERRGWIRYLRRMDDDYREEVRKLARPDFIKAFRRQIRSRKERESEFLPLKDLKRSKEYV